MNLGIDISQIVYKGTGVARFTRGLVEAILKYDNRNRWLFFFSGLRQKLDQDLKEKILSKKHRLVEWPIPPKILARLWNDWHNIGIIPNEFSKLDFFITSDWTEPKIPGVKKTTIVHDLVFKKYPETVEANILDTQKKRLELVVKESDLIFADSEATKNDILSFYGLDGKKVAVNYPGVDVVKPLDIIRPSRPFILAVGKLEPRKNIPRLVEAFGRMGNKNVDLLIVGPRGWQNFNVKLNMKNVKVLEYVSDQELYNLYSTCLFFVYPSLWEGFGIPVIEAMKLGAPVACSNTSSIIEIAKDAALTFDPENTENILLILNRMTDDPLIRKSLIEKGYKNAVKFTWKNYYDKMMKSIYDNRS